jgi:hypothetical protein
MKLMASLIIGCVHIKLVTQRLFRHMLVFLLNSPLKWKTAHRMVKYEFSYRKYS